MITVCVVPVAHGADDYNKVFEQALDAVEFDFDQHWAYTETRVDSEHVWVGRYDPGRPSNERWHLLSVDKRPPTEKEVEQYLEDRSNDHGKRGKETVKALVEPGTVTLIEETDEHWLLGFTPGEEEETIRDAVDATILVGKPTRHLKYIDIRNHSPMKPAIGIRISKLITRFTFGAAGDAGPVVPISTQVEISGRAYLFVSLDEQELVHNSDFEYVGED